MIRSYNHLITQGPLVGTYSCIGSPNQQWIVGADSISSVRNVNQCVTNAIYPQVNGAMAVINEFGNGEITFYGPDVPDQCAGVCRPL